MAKNLKRPPTSGTFKAGTEAPKAARNNQTYYREEMTQILISTLNETWKGQSKANKYVLIERLVALGCGFEFQIGKKKFQYAPDKGAIKEIMDRLMGRPVQAVNHGVGNGGKGRVTLVFDAPGDETD